MAKRFAAIVHISVDDHPEAHRKDVMEALERCLEVNLAEGEDASPISGVSVDAKSVAYYDDESGRPVVAF